MYSELEKNIQKEAYEYFAKKYDKSKEDMDVLMKLTKGTKWEKELYKEFWKNKI